MTPVNIGDLPAGPGWGCSCPAFRMGEPTPEPALAALARAVTVTVEDKGWSSSGTRRFEAWTEPENRYLVTYDPRHAGGWCKHIMACQVAFAPWHRHLALGAEDALATIKRLEKEARKRDREIRKLRSA